MTQRATKVRFDGRREERIIETILQAANSPDEQQVAWYRYLKAHLSFPFVATYRGRGGTKPFCPGAKVLIIGLAQPKYCKDSVYVRVMDGQASIRVSLDLLSLDTDSSQNTATVGDWQYWQARHFSYRKPDDVQTA